MTAGQDPGPAAERGGELLQARQAVVVPGGAETASVRAVAYGSRSSMR
ncbi:hypothetical protein AB0D57_36415 [Streptomyces sp. NPDC048275]